MSYQLVSKVSANALNPKSKVTCSRGLMSHINQFLQKMSNILCV